MSMELDVLQCQTYDLSVTPDLQDTKSSFHVALEAQIPQDSEFFYGVGPAWVDGTKRTDCERQEVISLLEASQAMPSSHECVDHGKENLQEAGDVISARAQTPFLSPPNFGNECHLSSNPITEMPSGEEKRANEMHNGPALIEDQRLQEPAQFCEGSDKMNDKLERVLEDNICGLNIEGFVAEDPSLSCQRDSNLDGCKAIMTGDVSISMLDNCSTEVGTTFSNDPPVSIADTNAAVKDVDILTNEPLNVCNSTCIHSLEQVNEQDMHFSVDGERKDDSGNSLCKVMLAEEHQAVLPNSEPTCGLDDYPSAIGENSNFHGVTGIGNSLVDSFAPRDSNVQDFCSGVGGNDTDFLNVDDDEGFDDGVENEINTEEAKSIETSGWSTRTRGVARYLKSLFDDEVGKSVTVNRLLAGKSRKEASRLFFETLVLKTKDYIHVEQDDSFGNVSIRPTARLLKTEF